VSKFFINRPIVAIVISILMVLVGAITIVSLPVSQFPAIAPPEVQVQTTYIGADAQTVEQSVATPIEQQMSGVDNMNYMYSVNANNGLMRLFVNFDLQTDPNIDHVLTQYQVASGAAVSAEGSWAMADGFGFTMSYTVVFENATADYDFARGPEALKFFENGKPARTLQPGPHDGYVGELQHMLDCIHTGTPPEVVDKIARDVRTVAQSADVRERFAALGAEPMPMTPTEFKQFVDAEIAESAKVVKAAGIKAQ